MKKGLEQVVKILIYGTFFVPLVVVPSSFIFPFIVPKILLLRALITLMAGGYVALLFINWEEYRPRMTPISLAFLVFLLSFALSTFVGVDWYHSFWDNHERMLGLFTILHYAAYYFIASALFRNWMDWKWAFRFFLIAGSIVMFIGVLQKGNPQLLLNQGSDRVASTLGNAIYVGGYGLFLFFAAVLLAVREKNFVWRFVEWTLGLLAIAGIFLSGTRGSILGLGVGAIAAAVGYAMMVPNRRIRFKFKIIVAFLIAGLLVAYVYRPQIARMNIPGLSRLFGTSFSFSDLNTRYIAWSIAIQSWKERPVFGWGPNNYFYAFNQHYNPRSLELGYGETWFDNAHNILLNTLAVQGLVGLLSYLAIFAVAGAVAARAGRRGQIDMHAAVLGVAFLAAHLVQNIFVFENPTSYLYFVFWLAFLNRIASSAYFTASELDRPSVWTQKIPDLSDRTAGFGAIGTIAAACLAMIFIFEVQPARANSKTLDAMSQLVSDPAAGFLAVKDALDFESPHIDDIRSDLARESIAFVNRVYTRLGRENSNEILAVITEALEKNLLLHPRDIRLYMMLAQIGQLQSMVNNDGRYLSGAERYLEASLAYSPRRQLLLYMLATVKAQLNKKDEAIRIMEQTIAQDRRIGESYWRLAYIYNFYKDIAKARQIIDLAKQNGIVFDDQGQQIEAMVSAAEASAGTRK